MIRSQQRLIEVYRGESIGRLIQFDSPTAATQKGEPKTRFDSPAFESGVRSHDIGGGDDALRDLAHLLVLIPRLEVNPLERLVPFHLRAGHE